MLFDLGDKEKLAPEIEAAVRDVLGEDTRLEPLLGSQLVAVLGVERSKGDEAMRAARAALTVAQAMPKAKVTVAVGHAIRGRGNLAGEALERAASQLELARPGAVRLDAYALAALEGRFVVQEDAQGGELLREDASGFGARQLLGRVTPTVGREKEIALLQGIYGELVGDGTRARALVAGRGRDRRRAAFHAERADAAPRARAREAGDAGPAQRRSDESSSSMYRRSRRAAPPAHGRARRRELARAGAQGEAAGVAADAAGRCASTSGASSASWSASRSPTTPTSRSAPRGQSAQLMQSRLRMALEAYVRAHDEALVLVIEDMHWADDTTLEMVDLAAGLSRSEVPGCSPSAGRRSRRARRSSGRSGT